MATDPTRIRFGPYEAPHVKKGDRSFCLYRDADVVVTAWTDARIQWPRCRTLHQQGGSRLLVTDEFKRAIASESAAALKHWFGVGTKAVWNWRRAFGVGRLGTPGSSAVMTELNRVKDMLKRETTRTPQERRRKRRMAKMLDLGRHLKTATARRWAGKNWTAEQVALLGTELDAGLAKLFGRSERAVRVRRTLLGIPTCQDRRLRLK